MLLLDDVADYRDLLEQHYTSRKAKLSLYTYRMMGAKLGLDTSQVFRILQKDQHLPIRCVPLAKDLLGLTGRSGQYFELLVAASRTRIPAKRQELMDKAFALRDVERRKINSNELRFFSQWWIPVVHTFLEVSEGRAIPEEIAASTIPPITKEQARDALEILKTLNLVKRLPSGRLGLSQAHLTVSGPEKALAVRSFQKQALSLGAAALDTIPAEERDISTLTLAVDAECFNDLREMAREFRRQVQKRVEESVHPDRVLQWTMALHPVARVQRSAS